jgi:hypothetical protein
MKYLLVSALIAQGLVYSCWADGISDVAADTNSHDPCITQRNTVEMQACASSIFKRRRH